MRKTPQEFVDPVTNPDLPWIVAPEGQDPFPEDHIHDEPGWDFEGAADNGQDFYLAKDLRGSGPSILRRFVPSAISGISLTNYSLNPQQKGWGPPCAAAHATITLKFARVTVDSRVAELVGLIMREAERRGYIHRAADTGAFNCRYIGGTTTWSNHAWALAIDINWQSNPFSYTLTTDIPEWYRHLWNRYGFAWGGDYSGKKDAMHFEFMGTPAQAAAALALARRELVPVQPNTWLPQLDAPVGQRVLEKWFVGSDVSYVQQKVAVGTDGYFGDGTTAAVKAYQTKNGLGADGVVGPATWQALGATPILAKASLQAGEKLTAGQALVSGRFRAVMQYDGNFVVVDDRNLPVWNSRTAGNKGAYLRMQTDGNVVIYSADNRPLWNTRTFGTRYRLSVQQDGNLVVYSPDNQPAWSIW